MAITISKLISSRPLMKRLSLVGGLAIVGFTANFIYESLTFVSTDDAQVAAYTATLSARVGGSVIDIPVLQNQDVHAGDPLIRIDPSDYQNRVDQMVAELDSVDVRLRDAEKNHLRMKKLLAGESVSAQQADSAEATFRELSAKRTSLAAQLSKAQSELDRTLLRAPSDGKVGKRAVEKGVVVSPGQALIAFVQAHNRWIEANFKETQIRNMKIGQKAEIEIDAISGHKFEGHVESFAPGSGATFSVLPPDNATGNFVKIVQRIPVRISLLEESIKGYENRLLPGLSSNVTIKVR